MSPAVGGLVKFGGEIAYISHDVLLFLVLRLFYCERY
jgi:hypothetical protein